MLVKSGTPGAQIPKPAMTETGLASVAMVATGNPGIDALDPGPPSEVPTPEPAKPKAGKEPTVSFKVASYGSDAAWAEAPEKSRRQAVRPSNFSIFHLRLACWYEAIRTTTRAIR